MTAEPHRRLPSYVRDLSAARLHKVQQEMRRLTGSTTPEDVHALRVAVRRFQSCLRTFHSLFPKKEGRKVRERIRKLMSLTADVRDRDIAVSLGVESGLPVEGLLLRTWREEREEALQRLLSTLHRMDAKGTPDKWRKRLEL